LIYGKAELDYNYSIQEAVSIYEKYLPREQAEKFARGLSKASKGGGIMISIRPERIVSFDTTKDSALKAAARTLFSRKHFTRNNRPRIYHISNGRKDRLGDIVEIINTMGPGKVHLGHGTEGKYSLAKYGPISAPLDISRLKELGFKPRPTKEALDDYAAWIRTEMKEGRTC